MPAPFDVVWALIAIAGFALFVAACVVLVRKRELFSATAAVLWLAVMLLVPIVGPLSLLLLTRGKKPHTQTTARAQA
jgi:hypothetical protein